MLKSGTRIRKINSEPSDGHPDGTEGVITANLVDLFGVDQYRIDEVLRHVRRTNPEFKDVEMLYAILWEGEEVEVWTNNLKIEPV